MISYRKSWLLSILFAAAGSLGGCDAVNSCIADATAVVNTVREWGNHAEDAAHRADDGLAEAGGEVSDAVKVLEDYTGTIGRVESIGLGTMFHTADASSPNSSDDDAEPIATSGRGCCEKLSPNHFRVYCEGFEAYRVKQLNPDWCWAACVEMLQRYEGVETSQEQIVLSRKNGDDDARGTEGDMVLALHPDLAEEFRNQNRITLDAFPAVSIDLVEELSRGHPVIMGLKTEFGDHTCVVHAAEYSIEIDPADVLKGHLWSPALISVTLADPDPGLPHQTVEASRLSARFITSKPLAQAYLQRAITQKRVTSAAARPVFESLKTHLHAQERESRREAYERAEDQAKKRRHKRRAELAKAEERRKKAAHDGKRDKASQTPSTRTDPPPTTRRSESNTKHGDSASKGKGSKKAKK
ncbi:MAG: hypothetical protein IPH13_09130 [Planctomycetes bacterium]|nr:hypothetical protein [Planctomycetota bacterium]